MARRLRFVTHEMQPFELTWRCAQGRFLMRPGEEANRRIIGVMGQAMRLFEPDDVHLYFAGGTCNHIHIIAAFRSARIKARWTCHVRTNISKELGHLYDWPGSHWERRSTDIAILDDEALYERLVYLAGQATRAGLVRRAIDWPGVPWIAAVTEGQPLVGVWYDRTRLYQLRQAWRARSPARRGRRPVLADVAEVRTLELTPPPMWAELDEAEQRVRWRAVVEVAEARDPAPARVLGAAGVLRVDPHDRPGQSKRSPAPAVHASSRALRNAWWAAYRAFADGYRRAMAALRAGIAVFGFPAEGCRPTCMAQEPGG